MAFGVEREVIAFANDLDSINADYSTSNGYGVFWARHSQARQSPTLGARVNESGGIAQVVAVITDPHETRITYPASRSPGILDQPGAPILVVVPTHEHHGVVKPRVDVGRIVREVADDCPLIERPFIDVGPNRREERAVGTQCVLEILNLRNGRSIRHKSPRFGQERRTEWHLARALDRLIGQL